MPRSECRGRVAVTYSLEVCCNQTGDRYAARRYERARFYREVTATRLAGLFTQSRQRWVCARIGHAPLKRADFGNKAPGAIIARLCSSSSPGELNESTIHPRARSRNDQLTRDSLRPPGPRDR